MTGNEVALRAPGELDSEADAYAFLERLRWGSDGPTQCPHCASEKGAWYLKPKDPGGRKSKGGSTARSQRRVWKCRENTCRRQFSVLTNTVLHATKMPVRAWVGTVVDLCRDPAGVSARDVADRWNVTEKSAWAMLTRIQDALDTALISDVDSEASMPVWLELAGAQREQVEQARAHRKQAATKALEARKQAEIEATEQVERDVKRALLEAETGRTPPGAGDTGGRNSHRSDTKKQPSAGASNTVSPPVSPPVSPAVEAVSKAESGPESGSEGSGEAPAMPASASQESLTRADVEDEVQAERRPVAVSDQVKSDVERALAEAFREPVPASKPVSDDRVAEVAHQRNPQESTRKASDSARITDPVPEASDAVTSPNKGMQRTVDGSDLHSNAGSASVESTPKRRPKKRKRSANPGRSAVPEQAPRSAGQPVDNTSEAASARPDKPQVSPHQRTAGDQPVRSQPRAQQRRERAAQARLGDDGAMLGADLLGGGWLDGPDEKLSGDVSPDQGKLRGIEAPELGPAWASKPAVVSDEAHSGDDVFVNQLDLFEGDRADPATD